MPPRRPPSTPAAASSTTTQRDGGMPSFAAALRKTCGSGLPIVTSSADTIASRYAIRDPGRAASRRRSRAGADEAIDCFQPHRAVATSHSRAPGSGFSPWASTSRRYSASLSLPDLRAWSASASGSRAPEDPIVALAEAGEKLLVGQLDPFAAHRVAPRQPVKLLRVDQGSVEIPEDSLLGLMAYGFGRSRPRGRALRR